MQCVVWVIQVRQERRPLWGKRIEIEEAVEIAVYNWTGEEFCGQHYVPVYGEADVPPPPEPPPPLASSCCENDLIGNKPFTSLLLLYSRVFQIKPVSICSRGICSP